MDDTYADLPLFAGTTTGPLPEGWRSYLPVLQTKPGEIEALQNTPPATWNRITPWIRVSQRREAPKRIETVQKWAIDLSAVLGHRSFYLDVLRPSGDLRVTTRKGESRLIVEALHEAARHRELSFIPTVRAAEIGTAVGKAGVQAAHLDGRGLALLVRTSDVDYFAGSAEKAVTKAIEASRLSVEHLDLIIDAGYLGDYEDEDIALTAEGVQALIATAQWRNVMLVGTSIPTTLTVVREGTLKTLPRREWDLWNAVRGLGGRVPTYGDYAVQNPTPPKDGGGPGMRTNIRYTLPHGTLVARGAQLTQASKAEYRVLCRWIVDSGEFKSRSYSWGDQLIEDCARGRLDPGAQNMWRGAGTSHHLAVVTNQLRRVRV